MESENKYGTLEIYTHGARLRGRDDRVKVCARRVLNNWVVKAEEKVENNRGEIVSQLVVKQLYGAAFPGSDDFWFHKSQLKELDTELKTNNITISDLEIDIIPTYTPDKAKFKLKQGRVLRDYQNNALEFALTPVTNGDHFSKLIAMPTGTGKATTLDTLVLTPDDWVKAGDLKVGQEVISVDGKAAVILGVFPQGIQEILKVTFKDQRTIRVASSHLWTISEETEPLTTIAIRDRLLGDKQSTTPIFDPEPGSPGAKWPPPVQDPEILSVEFDGFEECVCIEVDHPSHLYVCEDFVVTHNTVTLCGISSENAERMVIGVLPKYHAKWLKDLSDNLDINPKELMPVSNINQLRGLVDLCKTQGTKKLPPVIVITLSTLRIFYDKFVEDPETCKEDIGCEPWELMGLLKAGIFAIDEAHEHIHTVFRTAMFLHGPKFVALSGTMRTEDDFQERVQNAIFPQIRRYLDVKMEKYIDVEFIGYTFEQSMLPKMRCTAFGRSDYSHAVLEKSIIANPAVLRSYIQMNIDLLDFDYIKRQEGKRALLFVATVEMADRMVLALTLRYPSLKIARYCAAQGDKYADLLSADISVSTLQSSGTAVDIENLITVICTTMVNSSKMNLQALGRLRKLPNGEKVTMYLPFCRQNQKHRKYMQFRYELFKDVTKSIKTFTYDRRLGQH